MTETQTPSVAHKLFTSQAGQEAMLTHEGQEAIDLMDKRLQAMTLELTQMRAKLMSLTGCGPTSATLALLDTLDGGLS